MSPPTNYQHYGRMFAPTEKPVSATEEKDLVALGQAMKDASKKEGTSTPRAGFTYFGQFIDHDLTYDRTKLATRDVEPKNVPNYRTPQLDLELVYGEGPNGSNSSKLYEGEPGEERFKIGKTAPSTIPAPRPGDPPVELKGGTLRDFPRDEKARTALVVDPDDLRNLENPIVMQIHVLFMKFHNVAIEQCRERTFDGLGLNGNRFARARQLVLWHYQWLVHQHFLNQILPRPYLVPIQRDGPRIQWYDSGLFIPAEFAMAAFRFGHSIVRNSYHLNCHTHRSLKELMEHDLDPQGMPTPKYFSQALPEHLLVEWGRLFVGLPRSDQTTPSSPINTAVAPDLHELDIPTLQLFSDSPHEEYHKELPVRTLLRGARAALPSGQEVGNALVEQGLLKPQEILYTDQLTGKFDATNDHSGSVLAGSPLQEKTPLFYYLLKEAEVCRKGRKLGPIGSRIVGEVFETILRGDGQSYLRRFGIDWKLPLWRFPDGKLRTVNSIAELVRLVGDGLPEGCKAKFPTNLFDHYPQLGRLADRLSNLLARWG